MEGGGMEAGEEGGGGIEGRGDGRRVEGWWGRLKIGKEKDICVR